MSDIAPILSASEYQARIASLEALLARKNAALGVFADYSRWIADELEFEWCGMDEYRNPIALAARERDAT